MITKQELKDCQRNSHSYGGIYQEFYFDGLQLTVEADKNDYVVTLYNKETDSYDWLEGRDLRTLTYDQLSNFINKFTCNTQTTL